MRFRPIGLRLLPARRHPGERQDPTSVELQLKDGADASAQRRTPVVVPAFRRDDTPTVSAAYFAGSSTET
jgi:hypothetical protein